MIHTTEKEAESCSIRSDDNSTQSNDCTAQDENTNGAILIQNEMLKDEQNGDGMQEEVAQKDDRDDDKVQNRGVAQKDDNVAGDKVQNSESEQKDDDCKEKREWTEKRYSANKEEVGC